MSSVSSRLVFNIPKDTKGKSMSDNLLRLTRKCREEMEIHPPINQNRPFPGLHTEVRSDGCVGVVSRQVMGVGYCEPRTNWANVY